MENNLYLNTLRHLVNRHKGEKQYPITRTQSLSLIITLGKYFKERGYKGEKQRAGRLYVYSAICQRNITTSNDLHAAEAGEIRGYITDPSDYSLTREGTALLEALAGSFENGDPPYEGASYNYRFEDLSNMSSVQEAPF